eukprot:SAG31_NODE_140_length_22731_cov_10.941410_9_plen_149_part_00
MVCKSENYEMDMTIDVNSDLMPIERGFKFSVELATTLNVDNTPDTGVLPGENSSSAPYRCISAACLNEIASMCRRVRSEANEAWAVAAGQLRLCHARQSLQDRQGSRRKNVRFSAQSNFGHLNRSPECDSHCQGSFRILWRTADEACW